MPSCSASASITTGGCRTEIRNVTYDAAMQAARDLLHPDRATMVVAGPEASAS